MAIIHLSIYLSIYLSYMYIYIFVYDLNTLPSKWPSSIIPTQPSWHRGLRRRGELQAVHLAHHGLHSELHVLRGRRAEDQLCRARIGGCLGMEEEGAWMGMARDGVRIYIYISILVTNNNNYYYYYGYQYLYYYDDDYLVE